MEFGRDPVLTRQVIESIRARTKLPLIAKLSPNVTDIRNLGMACGIDLAPEGGVGARGYKAFVKAFELGLMLRQSGDALAMSPPLIIDKSQIDEIIEITGKTIKAVA